MRQKKWLRQNGPLIGCFSLDLLMVSQPENLERKAVHFSQLDRMYIQMALRLLQQSNKQSLVAISRISRTKTRGVLLRFRHRRHPSGGVFSSQWFSVQTSQPAGNRSDGRREDRLPEEARKGRSTGVQWINCSRERAPSISSQKPTRAECSAGTTGGRCSVSADFDALRAQYEMGKVSSGMARSTGRAAFPAGMDG